MFRTFLFGSFLTIALIPTGSFAQEQVWVTNPVEIKKERPPASGYEKLLKTPGRVVISKKYAVGPARMIVRVSYRENTAHLKEYTLHWDDFSIDLEKIPLLISDLERFVQRVKAAQKNDGDEVWYRYSDEYSVGFFSYRDDKGISRPYYSGQPRRWIAQGSATTTEALEMYIEGLKLGYSKLQELKKLR
jgi:hypothetical protein